MSYHYYPCPKCREQGRDKKGDNLCRFPDGGYYCFACNYTIHSLEENLVIEKKEPLPLLPEEELYFSGLPVRNISIETCKFFNYVCWKDAADGEIKRVCQYLDQFGKVKWQKVKRQDKKKTVIRGEVDFTLYGKWLWAPSNNIDLIITEGEEDAMAVSEAHFKTYKSRFPVVSIPHGTSSARKALEANLEYLQGFKTVLLGFDMDEPGREATEACMGVLDPGRVKVIRWG